MAVHVLGHLAEVARLAPRDWLRRTRRDVGGAGGRQWLIAASLVAGALLGLAMLGRVGPCLASAHVGHWVKDQAVDPASWRLMSRLRAAWVPTAHGTAETGPRRR